jgi:hypothetical protein
VITWYEKAGAKLVHIDALGSLDDVEARALKALEN